MACSASTSGSSVMSHRLRERGEVARGGYLCAMTDTAEIEERPATRRRPVGGVPVTIGCWVAVAGVAIWALGRGFGLESGFPFIQLISFTPYVAGAAARVPPLGFGFRRGGAAEGPGTGAG